jgi:hypothetical protein
LELSGKNRFGGVADRGACDEYKTAQNTALIIVKKSGGSQQVAEMLPDSLLDLSGYVHALFQEYGKLIA